MQKFLLFILLFFVLQQQPVAQSVAFNNNGLPADSSAILDVSAPYKGILIPRLSSQQRDSIIKPATALLIFNKDVLQFQVNLGTPIVPSWQNIVSMEETGPLKNSWKTNGNTGTDSTAFIGTIDNKPLQIKTNDILRLYVDSSSGRIGINTNHPRTSFDINATDAMIVPVGTTAERPAAPVIGMIRFNSVTGKLEGFTTLGWVALH